MMRSESDGKPETDFVGVSADHLKAGGMKFTQWARQIQSWAAA
jgi:hypothetical protein